MEVTILGSGTGTPSLNRNAAGILIKLGKENLLFDTGGGVMKKLLEIGITYHDLDSIFYTHFHTDHTLDLAAFLFAAKYALSLRTKSLAIFGAPGLRKFYQGLLGLYGEVIRPQDYLVELREITEESINLGACRIIAKKMLHTPESLGYRLEAEGQTVVYSGDTDLCQNLVSLGENADVLILDCSFPDEMKVKGHLTPSQAAEIAQAAGCKRLLLTHLYPVCQQDDIAKQAKKVFAGEVIVAHDLMKLEL